MYFIYLTCDAVSLRMIFNPVYSDCQPAARGPHPACWTVKSHFFFSIIIIWCLFWNTVVDRTEWLGELHVVRRPLVDDHWHSPVWPVMSQICPIMSWWPRDLFGQDLSPWQQIKCFIFCLSLRLKLSVWIQTRFRAVHICASRQMCKTSTLTETLKCPGHYHVTLVIMHVWRILPFVLEACCTESSWTWTPRLLRLSFTFAL